MKKTYTFSEARQKFASVLESAERGGEEWIVRKNGTVFIIRPEIPHRSPLDVPGIDLNISPAEIVALVREGRERFDV
jgi:antitoxin (DNA-binding transcriptional repressor) of toxin-antitoxin stability system